VHDALIFWFQVRDQPDSSLAVKFIAQTIVAAQEYSDGREVLLEVHRDNNVFFGLYNGALARIETSILALDRSIRIATQLQKRGTLPPAVWAAMPSKGAQKRISRLRNRIEHADKEVPSGKWSVRASSFLYGDRDKLEIADVEASWLELGRWIDQATAAARVLAMPAQ
jgi:hypothetical protein